MRIDAQLARARQLESDRARIGPRRDDEVILQLMLVAVIDHVNAGVNIAVFHLRVCRNICLPLRRIAADKVIALTC